MERACSGARNLHACGFGSRTFERRREAIRAMQRMPVVAGMIAALSAAACYAQAQSEFEVASVRATETIDGRSPCSIQLNPRNLARAIAGNRLRLSMSTIAILVMDAYNVREDQIAGLPAWANCSQHYELNALVPVGAALTEEQLRLMLQTLLAERFRLKLRHETKKITSYELNTAKKRAQVEAVCRPHPGTSEPLGTGAAADRDFSRLSGRGQNRAIGLFRH